MAMVNSKKTNLIGIDFGSIAIKIAELQNDGGVARLVTYGMAVRGEITVKSDTTRNMQSIIDHLSALLRQSRTSTTRAAAALPAVNVFTTVVELPIMPENEIDAVIRWEAKKLVPLPIEKMTLDWQPIKSAETPPAKEAPKTLKIILTAAPIDTVNAYMAIFRACGLQLVGLETEATATRRSILPDQPGCYLLLDIGASTTNVVIFSNGLPVVTRNINVGSEAINRNIANAINISPERAAQFRDDYGLPLTTGSFHPVSQAIAFTIDTLVIQEISRIVNTYTASTGEKISRIVIAGGSSHLKNLAPYIQSRIQLPTSIGDPWAKVSYPHELCPELKKIGPQMTVAIGLALKVLNTK